jgi:hypothetical protein
VQRKAQEKETLTASYQTLFSATLEGSRFPNSLGLHLSRALLRLYIASDFRLTKASSVGKLSTKEWTALKKKLSKGGRLEKFSLGDPEKEYVTSRGMDILRLHATDFVNKRIAPAEPKNDGRQTPAKGHPVFIAQHATGCNDRDSVEEFFGIKKGVELTEKQVEKVVDVILQWIDEHLTD